MVFFKPTFSTKLERALFCPDASNHCSVTETLANLKKIILCYSQMFSNATVIKEINQPLPGGVFLAVARGLSGWKLCLRELNVVGEGPQGMVAYLPLHYQCSQPPKHTIANFISTFYFFNSLHRGAPIFQNVMKARQSDGLVFKFDF